MALKNRQYYRLRKRIYLFVMLSFCFVALISTFSVSVVAWFNTLREANVEITHGFSVGTKSINGIEVETYFVDAIEKSGNDIIYTLDLLSESEDEKVIPCYDINGIVSDEHETAIVTKITISLSSPLADGCKLSAKTDNKTFSKDASNKLSNIVEIGIGHQGSDADKVVVSSGFNSFVTIGPGQTEIKTDSIELGNTDPSDGVSSIVAYIVTTYSDIILEHFIDLQLGNEITGLEAEDETRILFEDDIMFDLE